MRQPARGSQIRRRGQLRRFCEANGGLAAKAELAFQSAAGTLKKASTRNCHNFRPFGRLFFYFRADRGCSCAITQSALTTLRDSTPPQANGCQSAFQRSNCRHPHPSRIRVPPSPRLGKANAAATFAKRRWATLQFASRPCVFVHLRVVDHKNGGSELLAPSKKLLYIIIIKPPTFP